jgi:putative oxidoreductase
MKRLTDLGRIIFAIPFAVFGFNHFFNWELLALMYNTFIPIGVYTNFLIGIALIAVSICIILKIYIKLSCLLLAALLLLFIISIHIPQLFFNHNPEHLDSKFAQIFIITNMLKDISLMGGALMIAGLYPDNNKTIESK